MNAVVTPLDALIEGREKIARPYAWLKGKWHGVNKGKGCDCYCALGAVRAVYGIDEPGRGAVSDATYKSLWAAEAALSEATPDGAWDIVDYNDDPATKKRDILKTFDRAIATLKEQR